ncbi:hypothetical protein [Celeribacter sp. SCSIO 80788]
MFQMLLWFLRMMSAVTELDAIVVLRRRPGRQIRSPDEFGR